MNAKETSNVLKIKGECSKTSFKASKYVFGVILATVQPVDAKNYPMW